MNNVYSKHSKQRSYIFVSTLQEDKKILFYYPAKTDITTQVKNVGLSEAIIKFTE